MFFLVSSLIQLAQAQVWPDLSNPPKTKHISEDVALIVSIEDYFFVSDIEGTQQNGRDWYQYFTQTRGIRSENVVLLENQDATKESIETQSSLLADRVGDDGLVWFVFIGHGAPSIDGTDGLLLGSDVQQTAKSIQVRSVPQKVILQNLEKGSEKNRSNQVVAIIDACFSGKDTTGETLVQNLQPLIATQDLDIGSSVVLSAARHNEFAGPLPGLNRPAFSYLALGALQGWGDRNEDGLVSVDEVISYSKSTLLAVSYDRTQTPNMNGTERNLSLGKKYLDAPDIASIRLNLLPKTKTYLTQRIISSTVIAGGIALMNLGWQSWNDAAVARTEEQFDEDLKQGDNRAIGGVVGTTLGSVVLLYFSKKREDK